MNVLEHVTPERVVIAFLVFNSVMKAIRDAVDTTPEKDVNAFEKFVTILGKIADYLTTGKRAQ